MSQLVCDAVVGIEYPDCKLIANVPDVVIGEPLIVKPVGTVADTLVTVPVVELVPAPIAVLKSAADKEDTVLSAFILGNVTADGFVRVKKLWPIVDPPRLERPVAAFKFVEPPSHCKRWVYAESHSVCLAVVGIE